MPKRILLLILALTGLLVAGACTTTASPDAATPTPTTEATDGTPSRPDPTVFGFPDIASVVEKIAPAVVQVIATVEQRNLFGQTTQGRSQGSGVFFDEAGYILTNNHVVEDATEVQIATTAGRERINAEIVGTDPETDLAVLKINPEDVDSIVAAKLGDTDAMRIGDWVIAIGSPLGFQNSVTVGVVSAKGRSLVVDQGAPSLNDLVQTDAVINPGNSGGPLLNLNGEVIGINTAIIRGSIGNNQEAEGIGFAISMGTAIPVSKQLIENGRVIRPRIGVRIQDVTPAVAAEEGLAVDQGVLVISVAPGGPADEAGIQPNDVIVQVDSIPVISTTELVRLFLTAYKVGDTVSVTVVRASVNLTFDMELREVN